MRRRALRRFRVWFAVLAPLALIGAFWLSLPSAEPLQRANPSTTALIESRFARNHRRNQHWVRLSEISPWLKQAVVNSEDARFFQHHGVDVVETGVAIEQAWEGERVRGASTITQQLAKNLWLGDQRSVWRKVREYFLARRLETLGKDRILELYLNVAEWGNGIYGADAASRVWFGRPASDLLPEEAAVLAAMLPAPRKRNPRHPSDALRKRAAEVLDLFVVYKQLAPADAVDARSRMQGLLR
ncbi:MAG: transglycosylase domain-containing protein [Myxococcales bacterium]|nr:transglycosylase domain-containing protein [Myxococcales bacterium]